MKRGFSFDIQRLKALPSVVVLLTKVKASEDLILSRAKGSRAFKRKFSDLWLKK